MVFLYLPSRGSSPSAWDGGQCPVPRSPPMSRSCRRLPSDPPGLSSARHRTRHILPPDTFNFKIAYLPFFSRLECLTKFHPETSEMLRTVSNLPQTLRCPIQRAPSIHNRHSMVFVLSLPSPIFRHPEKNSRAFANLESLVFSVIFIL